MRVLIVEDSSDLRALWCSLARTTPFELVVCEDGHHALECFNAARLNDNKFDVIVLDAAMPDMDGFHVAAFIRQDEPEIPIVFLTAFDEPMIAVRAHIVDARAVWIKPITPLELSARIQAILDSL